MCNLAPGDLRKEGPWLDLPMAIALAAVNGEVPREELEGTLLLGELGLDGELRPIDGAVSVALMAMERGYKRLIVPEAIAPEAAVAVGVEVYGVRRLLDAVELLNGSGLFTAQPFAPPAAVEFPDYGTDYADVKGQRHAVRALEVAEAGDHNVLMSGRRAAARRCSSGEDSRLTGSPFRPPFLRAATTVYALLWPLP